jgi:hypothetical protein
MRRKDCVAVVDDEPAGMIESQKLPELLSRPLGSGMLSDVRVENAPRTDLQGYEDIQDAERSGHRNEKVAGNDGFRMIPDKGLPTLAGASAWIATLQIMSWNTLALAVADPYYMGYGRTAIASTSTL